MKGKARDRFNNRACTLRTNRKADTFSAFVSAMGERFKVDKEDDVNYEKLWKAKCSDNALDYTDKLKALNLKAGVTGLTWRKIIQAGLPHPLREKLAFGQGGEPQEDDALIAITTPLNK